MSFPLSLGSSHSTRPFSERDWCRPDFSLRDLPSHMSTCVTGNNNSSWTGLLWRRVEMPGQELFIHFLTFFLMPSRSECIGLFCPVLSGKYWPLNRSFKLVQQCRVHDSGYSWAINCSGHHQLSREKAQLGKAFQMLSQFLFGGFLKSFLPNLYEWGTDEISGHSFFSDSLFYIWFLELLSKFCRGKKTLESHRHEPSMGWKALWALLGYTKPHLSYGEVTFGRLLSSL